jgi:N-acetylneuraminic acid mutarotase
LKTGARTHRPAWQIGLLIVIALLLLLGGGMLGARLLARPTPLPTTVAAGATAQATIEQRWSTMAEMPSPRKGMGIVAYENALYLVAGETSEGIDGVLLRYEQEKNTWSTLASKKTPVTDVQAALVGEKIYVPGGRRADGSTTDLLEVYDPRKGTWENKAPLPEPLSAYGIVSFEGQLYLFGGKNGEQFSAGVYVYDPREDRWSTRTELQSPRAYMGVVESGGKIFVIGGYDGKHALDLNEAYLPNRDIDGESPWKTFAPLPERRYAMGVAQVAGLVYLLGGTGENGQALAKPALQYNVQADQWGEYETPPVNVGTNVSLLTAGNYLHVLGGETSAGLSATNLTYRTIYTIAVPILVNDGD